MRQSQLFPKTRRETPKDADNISAALLTRGGFIRKLMAGSYTFGPIGWRVIKKIETIVRQAMDAIDGQELLMPAMHPKELWERSGRWTKLKDEMYQFKDPSQRPVGLGMTHEEVVVDLLSQQPLSYQDLPLALYQFQTKFRHEPRAKSGILRTREFIMKDLYSVHANEASLDEYYQKVETAYKKIFAAVEVPTIATLASGGIFTDDFSHEFQAVCPIGEDTIYICPQSDYAVNKEVLAKTGPSCPAHKIELEERRAVEVGNIFKLGTKFSTDMGVLFTDADGKQKPFWFASYGIGLGRLMGVIVEQHHDANGIIWPEKTAPFKAHLLSLNKTAAELESAEKIYRDLRQAGIEVLFDDRPVAPGIKFADADLLGIPRRLVVSPKTLVGDSVEVKARAQKESKLVKIDHLINGLIKSL